MKGGEKLNKIIMDNTCILLYRVHRYEVLCYLFEWFS